MRTSRQSRSRAFRQRAARAFTPLMVMDSRAPAVAAHISRLSRGRTPRAGARQPAEPPPSVWSARGGGTAHIAGSGKGQTAGGWAGTPCDMHVHPHPGTCLAPVPGSPCIPQPGRAAPAPSLRSRCVHTHGRKCQAPRKPRLHRQRSIPAAAAEAAAGRVETDLRHSAVRAHARRAAVARAAGASAARSPPTSTLIVVSPPRRKCHHHQTRQPAR